MYTTEQCYFKEEMNSYTSKSMRYGNPNHEKIAFHWFEEHETLLQKEDNTEDDAEYLQEQKSFCCSHYN